ncbi:FKBP-type peptidyl-prolyl cis-trans isomerase [Amycolatopsis jiangsuensis]|uniref:Peptidyl-prolyl cis-trans isomerase n=1 Tax=Amycolatopsis jiangsuensis TaxID=1181879 RepID=A0A840ITU6_9PSEU|nr:FKBP-type peptidyl-prolyl cis-trans isomerase [Amycolatopsis jiangsuensis]MBB4684578.1 peptidylprolyl isomerase [Amycolatopsis jiangsuensis]
MQRIGKIAAVAACAVAAGSGLTACGGDSDAAPSRACTADDIATTGSFGQAPEITIPDDCAPPAKLVTKDLSVGTGAAAQQGQAVAMDYTVVTWSDKKQLDTSFGKEPFTLHLGAGEVIQGWDQGLAGIKQGGRRLLIIPPDLAYGQGGRGIAPNETLVFVADAVAVPAAQS